MKKGHPCGRPLKEQLMTGETHPPAESARTYYEQQRISGPESMTDEICPRPFCNERNDNKLHRSLGKLITSETRPAPCLYFAAQKQTALCTT